MLKIIFAFFICIQAGAQVPALVVADSLFSIGKYSEAISEYEKTGPMNASLHIKIAQAYRAQGNFGNALAHYELALAEKGILPATSSDYGKLLYHTGNFRKADSIFKKLTIHFPNNPDFQYQLGLAREQMNDSTAVEHYRKAFSLDNTHQKAIYELAVHQFQQEKNKKVEDLGKTALRSYPKNVEMLSLLGQNAMAMRNYPLAAKRFEHLLSLNEKSEFIHENLGLAYYHLGELEKALEHYQVLVDLNPKHINAHYFSGRIFNLLDQPQTAETHLKKALKLKKVGLSGMYHALGTSFKLKRDFSKAIDCYKLALEENQYNIRAQFDLAIAAEQYYKDVETRLNYYKIFVRKFKDFPHAKSFLTFAEYRISELKKERFLGQGKDQ